MTVFKWFKILQLRISIEINPFPAATTLTPAGGGVAGVIPMFFECHILSLKIINLSRLDRLSGTAKVLLVVVGLDDG